MHRAIDLPATPTGRACLAEWAHRAALGRYPIEFALVDRVHMGEGQRFTLRAAIDIQLAVLGEVRGLEVGRELLPVGERGEHLEPLLVHGGEILDGAIGRISDDLFRSELTTTFQWSLVADSG
jgi:hypothetical protein